MTPTPAQPACADCATTAKTTGNKRRRCPRHDKWGHLAQALGAAGVAIAKRGVQP